jgi:hypothetical protein
VRLSRANALPFVGLLELHDRYNAAVRRVGVELAALVVDMDRQYRVDSGSRGFAPTDAIHPTQAGHNLEAETLYRVLQGRGVVSGAKPRGEYAQ